MRSHIVTVKPAFTMSICDMYDLIEARIYSLNAQARLATNCDPEYRASAIRGYVFNLCVNLSQLNELLTGSETATIDTMTDSIDSVHKSSKNLSQHLRSNIQKRRNNKERSRNRDAENPDPLTPPNTARNKTRQLPPTSSTPSFERVSVPTYTLLQTILTHNIASQIAGKNITVGDIEQSLLNFADTIFQWAEKQTEIIYNAPNTPLDIPGIQELMDHIRTHKPKFTLPDEPNKIYIGNRSNLEFCGFKFNHLTLVK